VYRLASGVRGSRENSVPIRPRVRARGADPRAQLTAVARGAGIALAKASAAARGDPVNVATALKLSRAVGAAPVVPKLDAWIHRPGSEATNKHDGPGNLPSATTI
jgi:hypothetical protein